MARRGQAGMVLIYLLLVVAVLAILAGGVACMGNSSLSVARADRDAEEAWCAAEAGLAAAADQFSREKTLDQPYQGSLSEGRCRYSVALYQNTTSSPMDVAGGVKLPPLTVYLLSTGWVDGSTITRRVGALFRQRSGAFQVGGLASLFDITNSIFDAFDSRKEAAGYAGDDPDPGSMVTSDTGILATNECTGRPFRFTSSTVKGGVFVGPGGDPAALVQQMNSCIQKSGSLKKRIDLSAIKVPDLPQGKGYTGGGDPTPSPSPSAKPTAFSFNNMSVTPPAKPGDPVSFQHYCFSLRMWPDGRFTAAETGSSSTASGNMQTQTATTSGKFKVSFNPFKIEGAYHVLDVNPGAKTIGVEPGPPTIPHLPADYQPVPDWVFGIYDEATGNSTASANTPQELEGGRYKDVTVDGRETRLKSDQIYVIENLTVQSGGSLALLATNKPVEVYVTNRLSVSGENALLNQTRKAPNLNLYYTGTNPVQITGGARAYFTLLAPNADIVLDGKNASFFGALAGKSLTVKDARFHFDVGTEGVGSGQEGQTLTLLARHRL